MINRALPELSITSRRYFLAALLISLTAGYLYEQATDQMAQMLWLAITIAGLFGSITMLRQARRADKILFEQQVEQIHQQYDTVPWVPEWNPTKRQVNQTLRQIAAQERRR